MKAREFLQSVLSDGCDAPKVFKEAERQGIAKATVQMQAGIIGFKSDGKVFRKFTKPAKPEPQWERIGEPVTINVFSSASEVRKAVKLNKEEAKRSAADHNLSNMNETAAAIRKVADIRRNAGGVDSPSVKNWTGAQEANEDVPEPKKIHPVETPVTYTKDGNTVLSCGCIHDGVRWLKMCAKDKAETEATHARWAKESHREGT